LHIVSARLGSNIWQLTRETYGEVDPQLVAGVLAVNPNISDPDQIQVGAVLLFPPLATMRPPEE
jgi:hypothetical protein